MIEDNPCKNIFVPKGRKKEKEIYTVEEMKQLFALAEEYGTLDYRAFLTLAVYSGFRSGELEASLRGGTPCVISDEPLDSMIVFRVRQ